MNAVVSQAYGALALDLENEPTEKWNVIGWWSPNSDVITYCLISRHQSQSWKVGSMNHVILRNSIQSLDIPCNVLQYDKIVLYECKSITL